MADDAVLPSAVDAPAAPPGFGVRLAAVGHRIRSGEDPLAFGAVVVVLALGAGLFWFWAGARHGSVAAASPSPPRAERGEHEAAPAGREHETPGPEHTTGGPERGPGGPGEAGDGADGTPAAGGQTLAVHVAGAVLRPGLYHLPGGARVADAVAAAGGRLPRADLDRLNLAARLADGQKVFVARRGEPVPPDVAGGGMGGGAAWVDGAAGPAGETAGPPEPIDLNAADLTTLDSLPGVGPATARAILEERARRGGFRSTRDLLRIPGFGESRFARLKDHVRV